MRGLKRDIGLSTVKSRVAPFTGAWIETGKNTKMIVTDVVAPFTGAWIETS